MKKSAALFFLCLTFFAFAEYDDGNVLLRLADIESQLRLLRVNTLTAGGSGTSSVGSMVSEINIWNYQQTVALTNIYAELHSFIQNYSGGGGGGGGVTNALNQIITTLNSINTTLGSGGGGSMTTDALLSDILQELQEFNNSVVGDSRSGEVITVLDGIDTNINDIREFCISNYLAYLTYEPIEIGLVSNVVNVVDRLRLQQQTNHLGFTVSTAQLLHMIYNYLSTSEYGKPLKESLADITSALDSLVSSNSTDRVINWLTGVDPIGGHVGNFYTFPEWLDLMLTNSVPIDYTDLITYISNRVHSLGWVSTNLRYIPDNYDSYFYALGLADFYDDKGFEVLEGWAPPLSNNQVFDSIVGYEQLLVLLNALNWGVSSVGFDTSKIGWDTIISAQTNQSNIATALFTGDIQDKYSFLTNLYATDGPYDMPYTERLELLLAALVFADDAQADTNQTSFSDAETNAEDIKTQYVSLVNQLNQTILGDVKSNIERTDRSLLSFFQSLDSALSFQYQPNIHIVHNVDSNFGTDSLPNGFGIGDYWEFDLESNGVDTFIKFCRACTSIVILSGWLFIVWQLGRGTAKICWRMAVLAFKTCSKLLG